MKEEWKAGLICYFSREQQENIYKIFSDGRGLKIQLNKEFTTTLGEHEAHFLEGVIRAGIEGYGSLYMKSKSLLHDQESPRAETKKDVNGSKKAKKEEK